MPFVEFKVSQKIERDSDTEVLCQFYEGDFGVPEEEGGLVPFLREGIIDTRTFFFDPGTSYEEIQALIAEYTSQVTDLDLIPEQAALINGPP